jgi:hypothetical protein
MNPIISTASRAMDHVVHETQSGRGTFLDLGIQIVRLLNTIRSRETHAVDSALDLLGLRRKHGMLAPVALFAAGAVVGTSLTLLLAPTTGKNLRTKLLGFLGPTHTTTSHESLADTQPTTSDAMKATNGAEPSNVATFRS